MSTGIRRAQSRQIIDTPTYSIEGFSSLEFFIQLYEPMASWPGIIPDYSWYIDHILADPENYFPGFDQNNLYEKT